MVWQRPDGVVRASNALSNAEVRDAELGATASNARSNVKGLIAVPIVRATNALSNAKVRDAELDATATNAQRAVTELVVLLDVLVLTVIKIALRMASAIGTQTRRNNVPVAICRRFRSLRVL